MRPIRLRWRLAASHAVLALVLVLFASNRIEQKNRDACRAQATAGVERDAAVLATRAARVFKITGSLADLIDDENVASRQAAVVSVDGTTLAGPPLTLDAQVEAAMQRVLSVGDPTSTGVRGGSVMAASPVVVDDVLAAVALESEPVPNQSSGLAAQPLSDWRGLAIVLAAALIGWFLAGRISRPIGALTEQARRVALGDYEFEAPDSSLPEVATLSAAIAGIALRERKLDDAEGERRRMLRALTRRLSHQLRTPLSVLRLRLDDLEGPGLPADRRALVADVMSRQIDLLDELGDQLAPMDPMHWELEKAPVDVSELVARVVKRNKPLARWGGVSLRAEQGSQSAVVVGDENLLEDAVANVVQNAVKFTPQGGWILVHIDLAPDSVTVVVTDSGPGIEPDERGLILHPGVRGSAGSLAGGTGHGLALVADTIDRHGGHLEFESADGVGAVVRLVLPIGSHHPADSE
jgi:signal transduction histidine kinase